MSHTGVVLNAYGARSGPLAAGFGATDKADVDFVRGQADIAVVGTQAIRVLEQQGVGAIRGYIEGLRGWFYARLQEPGAVLFRQGAVAVLWGPATAVLHGASDAEVHVCWAMGRATDERRVSRTMTGDGIRTGLLLIGIMGLAFAIRSIGVEDVLGDPSGVILNVDDGAYHARRVLWGVANFPRVLTFDPYLNYPSGAPVPWPPLFDMLLTFVAWCIGGSRSAVDAVLVWSSPFLASLAVIPIYVGARTVVGKLAALGAT
jgi:hypothetical protein